MVYQEVKRLNRRLDFLEELIEDIIIRDLPKTRLNNEEIEEIKKSIEEMKRGECIKLDELRDA